MRKEFEQDLRSSLYIHRPLPLHFENSLEAGFPDKKVEDTLVIYDAEHQLVPFRLVGAEAATTPGIGNWTNETDEPAYIVEQLPDEAGTITIKADIRGGRPVGAIGEVESSGTLDHAEIEFTFEGGMDWRGYNRLHYELKPEVEGMRILFTIAKVHNEGEVAVPDRFDRTGECVCHVINHEWNDLYFEFDDMPRDKVTKLRFFTYLTGRDYETAAKDLIYSFRNIRLEKVAEPEHERGWLRADDKITFSTGGYWRKGVKTAVTRVTEGTFALVDENSGEEVFSAPVKRFENQNGVFGVLDFTSFEGEGCFRLKLGDQLTREFEIGDDIQKESVWKVLNFVFGERCGYMVPGRHGACHLDTIAWKDGLGVPGHGGWHDAGDQSQQAAQSSEIMVGLLTNAMKVKGKDEMMYLRLMEEAQWGLDYILRTRFGGGYRLVGVGNNHWTDNMIVLGDDSGRSGRGGGSVSNASINNFIMSGAEAYAALCLQDYDADLAVVAKNAAVEDLDFADARFTEVGVETEVRGHVKVCGYGTYCGIAAWSASLMLQLTGDKEKYAPMIRKYCEGVLACQETGGAGIPIKGFFYRDRDHRMPQHWNHQSREYAFVQGLEAACRALPDDPDKVKWEEGMKLYGQYLKDIFGTGAPYGMAPSGIHTMAEADDAENFSIMHLIASPEKEGDSYRTQLENGVKVADGWYIRNFPVWFSFRGNAAVQLASGMAAAIVGEYFGDDELIQIGKEQIYWDWGKNPFGQSIVYGVGTNYCREYALECGELVGEIPVGMESYEDEDRPYWPMNNNCTYREVWVGPVARYLWLAGMLTGC